MTRLGIALIVGLLAAPALAQDVKGVGVLVRSKQPAVLLDHQQAAQVLRDHVVTLGAPWAFLRKDGGNNCDVGARYRVSCDWIINAATNQGCDFWVDAPGYHQQTGAPVRGTMQPNPGGCHLERSPGEAVPLGSGSTTPPTTPPAVDLTPILQRLATLEERAAALRTDVDALLAPRPLVLPLDILVDGLRRVYFECTVSRNGGFLAHGHPCTIGEPRPK